MIFHASSPKLLHYLFHSTENLVGETNSESGTIEFTSADDTDLETITLWLWDEPQIGRK